MRKETSVISLPDRADQHDHGYHQLVFGLEGDTEFDLAGYCRPVNFGWGCLLPSATGHAFHGLGDNRIVVVNLPTEGDDRQLQQRIEQLFRRPDYFNCAPQMQLLLNALSREMQQNPSDTLLQDACASTLVCALQRQLEHQRSTPRRLGQLNMELIDTYIDLHIDRRIGVAELAGSACLSESQFFALFRDQTGQTPQQYVMERRLQSVAAALANTDCGISELAARFGFASQSNLTRAFSRRFDTSPLRYRRAHQR
ncbi:AraC family transcriptional regulator [Marinobacterium sp. D7]|uniref:helix-turn-helix domain-containing protein n=1 Tax=Marinobacterium ramblicola TaxID=2849041 RepID=UPI001C2DCB64|nr:AraC family transcriptional regulator [Marinobacterium ramblicola]MBV1787419.1 AraC family transcriptional regulator [Marinobacterium ramblicola]